MKEKHENHFAVLETNSISTYTDLLEELQKGSFKMNSEKKKLEDTLPCNGGIIPN